MEDSTPFSLNEAIRRWRAEFGSPSSLSAAELEELEGHLRDHVAQLEAAGMTPEAACAVAMKQLGERQRVATEFAKINPQRIWLERAIWMALGVFLFAVLSNAANATDNIIFSRCRGMGWNPPLCVVFGQFGGLGGTAAAVALLWFVFSRKPGWGRALVDSCERSLLATGTAMVLLLWGSSRLSYFYDYLLGQYAPRLHGWLLPAIQIPAVDEAAMNLVSICWGMAEDMFWAVALCVLAVRAVRGRHCLLLTAGTPPVTTKALWGESLLWMVAGWVLVRCGAPFLHECVMIPASWMVRALGASAVLEHLAGLVTAAFALALWAFPFWTCWLFGTRYPQSGDWWRRAFRYRPFWTSVGVALLLNAHVVLFPIMAWTGMQARIPVVGGPSPIVAEWNYGAWMVLCHRVLIAVLLVALLRWRMKLREA